MSSTWHGERVRLRAPEPADYERFRQDGVDNADDARLYDHIGFPRSEGQARERFEQSLSAAPEGDAYRWAIENEGGELVGGINTHHCDRRNGTFEYGLGIFEDHRRHGYASEAITIVLRYFFDELGYQKVNAPVHSFNDASIDLHQGLGFREEGRLRRMVYTNGEYHDEIVFGMTAEEFREQHPR